MSTITKEFTKEQLIEVAQEIVNAWVEITERESDSSYYGIRFHLAKIALASLESEPVCYLTWHQGFRAPDDCEEYVVEAKPGDKSCDGSPAFPVYTAQPAPMNKIFPGAPDKELTDDVLDEIISGAKTSLEQYLALSLKAERSAPPVPVFPGELLSTMEEVLRISDRDHDAWIKAKAGIASCRAAMLQGANGNSPVIPDWQAEAEKMAEFYGSSFVVFRSGESPQCADPSKVVISFTDEGLGHSSAAPQLEVK